MSFMTLKQCERKGFPVETPPLVNTTSNEEVEVVVEKYSNAKKCHNLLVIVSEVETTIRLLYIDKLKGLFVKLISMFIT